MNVTLIRHFKVDYRWQRSYESEGYARAQREYDLADVSPQTINLPLRYDVVFVSTSKRTLQTLRFLAGSLPYEANDLLTEVPLAPFVQTKLVLPLWLWLIMGRLQWVLNAKRQPETKSGSVARAISFLETLKSVKGNCLIVGHGFFLRVLSRQMIAAGFIGKRIGYLRNGEHKTYSLQ